MTASARFHIYQSAYDLLEPLADMSDLTHGERDSLVKAMGSLKSARESAKNLADLQGSDERKELEYFLQIAQRTLERHTGGGSDDAMRRQMLQLRVEQLKYRLGLRSNEPMSRLLDTE